MTKRSMLVIDPGKCTGCRLCETVCSLSHEGVVAPRAARITVVKVEETGADMPVVCQQCERPMCMEVCPSLAITRNEETGVVSINASRCLGCGMCVMACPIGGITVTAEKVMKKCDLCGGDPRCAAYCPTKAIEFLPISRVTEQKRRKGAERMLSLLNHC